MFRQPYTRLSDEEEYEGEPEGEGEEVYVQLPECGTRTQLQVAIPVRVDDSKPVSRKVCRGEGVKVEVKVKEPMGEGVASCDYGLILESLVFSFGFFFCVVTCFPF